MNEILLKELILLDKSDKYKCFELLLNEIDNIADKDVNDFISDFMNFGGFSMRTCIGLLTFTNSRKANLPNRESLYDATLAKAKVDYSEDQNLWIFKNLK